MFNIDPEVMSGIVSGLFALAGVVVSGVVGWWFARRTTNSQANQNDASAAASITSSAQMLIDPLREEIAHLNAKLTTMNEERQADTQAHLGEMKMVQDDLSALRLELYRKEGQIQELRGGVDVLIGQLKQLNIKPKYDPGY